ncbi:MAG TPA: hypothetical protein VGO76_08240 [Luteibacter sp.]|nr:hypothetical protein [Luteibacter sp.]
MTVNGKQASALSIGDLWDLISLLPDGTPLTLGLADGRTHADHGTARYRAPAIGALHPAAASSCSQRMKAATAPLGRTLSSRTAK